MSEHIVPTRVYYLVFAALMVGTYLTVQAAFIDLGVFNTVVALAIACAKAMLVILFFAITGSPLFGPFVSEFQMLSGAFAAGRLYVGLTFLALLLLVFLGMGNSLLGCSLGPPPPDDDESRFEESLSTVLPIGLSLLLTLILGVYNPPFLTDWVQQAADFLQRAPAA